MVVEVSAGDDPAFTLTRVSRGTPDAPRDNEVSDGLTVRRTATPPDTPQLLAPLAEALIALPLTLRASPFLHPDGAEQGAAHWQVAPTCDFTEPTVDAWIQSENRFGGEDNQAGDELADHVVASPPTGPACLRVRYRDAGLRWSTWSDAVAFEVE